jgi:hypothetical protein
MNRREVTGQDQSAALDAYRAAAHAEADAHFDERALETQRHKILERLAHLGHPAKVIRFPVTPRGPVPATGINRRWITAAAAAGLILGLVSGQFVHFTRTAPRVAARPDTAPLGAPGYRPAVNTMPQDDGLLGEIDVAVQLRSAAELRALDELTPFHEPR